MPSLGKSPLEILLELEQRSRRNAAGLPQQIEIRSTWDGIGFRLGAYKFVAAMEAVREILTQPNLTRVPGVKDWVKGVANVRGNLLPVIDLGDFLAGAPSASQRRARVLVVQHRGLGAGLLVDEVLGMRHFLEEEFSREKHGTGEEFRGYLDGVYRQAGEQWWVFDLRRLVESPAFMQVAA